MDGPGVLAPIEKEIEDLIFTEAEAVDLWPEDRNPAEHLRRSLYLFRKRNVRYPLFDAFDAPDTQSACPRRATSTHALQALALLNSEFAAGRARALAGRVLHKCPPRAMSESSERICSCWHESQAVTSSIGAQLPESAIRPGPKRKAAGDRRGIRLLWNRSRLIGRLGRLLALAAQLQ